jgi:hypothetical protein
VEAVTEGVVVGGPLRAGSPLRTPRAAAAAGIIFSVLLITALVLLRISVPAHAAEPGAWLTNARRRATVAIALNLIPFAGIAFLWFVGVVRDRIGEREDRFFATVFLGSGLLFVGMLFVGAAVAGGLIASQSPSGPPIGGILVLGRHVSVLLLNVYAMRMAAVFTHHGHHRPPHQDRGPVAHHHRPGERAGAAGRRGDSALGRTAVPRMDPGAEHRHPRARLPGLRRRQFRRPA